MLSSPVGSFGFCLRKTLFSPTVVSRKKLSSPNRQVFFLGSPLLQGMGTCFVAAFVFECAVHSLVSWSRRDKDVSWNGGILFASAGYLCSLQGISHAVK